MDYTTKYFRITAYYPQEDICFIMDSNGMFEKLWQFSAFIIAKGCKILEVSNDEKFLDINISKAKEDRNHVFIRASAKGKPIYTEQIIDGKQYTVVEVQNKRYIPEK